MPVPVRCRGGVCSARHMGFSVGHYYEPLFKRGAAGYYVRQSPFNTHFRLLAVTLASPAHGPRAIICGETSLFRCITCHGGRKQCGRPQPTTSTV